MAPFGQRSEVVTRKDVAKRAGVSPATVSYALNPDGPVSDATRARVLAAAAELGYTPNAMAAALAGAPSRVIALVTTSSEREVEGSDLEYLVGATEAARALGYQVLLWALRRREFAEIVRLSRASAMVSGVLLMEVMLDDERVDYLKSAQIPFGLVGRNRDVTGIPAADRDFDRVASMALTHLAGLGHREVVFLSASESASRAGFGAVVRAESAFMQSAGEVGMRAAVVPCDLEVNAGKEAFWRIRERYEQATAIVSFNEEATFGLFQAARTAGVAIPSQLSVMSTSVTARHAAHFDPALTSISPPGLRIGAAAARALITRLQEQPENEALAELNLFAGELIQRGSTAPPPHRGARAQ